MPRISDLNKVTELNDTDLFLIQLGNGPSRAITFADLQLEILMGGGGGGGNMTFVGSTPVTVGFFPVFQDTSGNNYESSVVSSNQIVTNAGDIATNTSLISSLQTQVALKQDKSPIDGINYVLLNGDIDALVIASTPGLQDALDLKIEGPATATDSAIVQYDGTTGKLAKDGPVFGSSTGDAILLEDVSGNPGLPAVDGSQLTNLLQEVPLSYSFNTSVSASDPGLGFVSLSSADPDLADTMFISTQDRRGADMSELIDQLDTNSKIFVANDSDSTFSVLYNVTGKPVLAGNFYTISIFFVGTSSPGQPSSNDSMSLTIDNSEALNRRINEEASSKIIPGSGGALSIDSPGVPPGESFSVTAGKARITNIDTTQTDVNFGPFNGVTITTTTDTALLFINSSGILVQKEAPSPNDMRTLALLGFATKDPTTGLLVLVGEFPPSVYQTYAHISDIGFLISGAADSTARIDDAEVADTSFQRFAGKGYSFLGNLTTDVNAPSEIDIPALSPTTFRTYLFDGVVENVIYSGLGTDTLIDPTVFDNLSGALVTMPGNNSQSQIIRVFWQPNALTGPEIRIIHGQELFANLAEAVNGLASYFPVIPSQVELSSIDLGGIVVRKGASDFTDTGHAVFFRRSQISGGGGGSVQQSMQDTYQNSLQPQITTAVGDGAIQFKDGQADDSLAIFEILDENDTVALKVTGAGVTTARGLDSVNTGVIFMSGPVTLDTVTTVDIPAIDGLIINGYDDYLNILTTEVKFPGQLGFTIPNLGTEQDTYLFIDSSSNLQTQNTSPTPAQRRTNVYFASTLNNTNTAEILAVLNAPVVAGNVAESFKDRENFQGILGDGGGVEQTFDTGTNGLLAMEVGQLDIYLANVNWHASKTNPNTTAFIAQDPVVFNYMLQDGSLSGGAVTLIEPGSYDVGGVKTTIPGNNARSTIQYIWKLIDGSHIVQFGQDFYTDFDDALNAVALDRQLRVTPDILLAFGIELAAIVINKVATDLADPTEAAIVQIGGGGGGSGGGAGSTTYTGLTDTSSVAGTTGAVVLWDNPSETLLNSEIVFNGTADFFRLQDLTSIVTDSLYIGADNNALNIANDNNCVLGNEAADSITNVGTLTASGNRSATSLSTGTGFTVLGYEAALNVVTATNSVALGVGSFGLPSTFNTSNSVGVNNFSAITSATNCGIYGNALAGPAGAITDYLNIHGIIQAELVGTGTVVIGGAVNTKPADTHWSLQLGSTDGVLGLNSLTNTQEGTLSPNFVDGDLWYNNEIDEFKFRRNGATEELLSISGNGVTDSIMTWDASGNLQNTDFKYTDGNGFTLFETGGLNNESLYFGVNNNQGLSTVPKNTAFGHQALQSVTAASSLVTAVGGNAAASLTAGSSGVFIGEFALRNTTDSNQSVVVGSTISSMPDPFADSISIGYRNFFSVTDSTKNIIIGHNIAGPVGIVSDYLNIQQTIQADTSNDSVTIGDAINVKPTNTHRSLALESNTQVLGLNSLTNAQELTASASITERDIWYNSDRDKYRVKEAGIINDLIAGLPTNYIQWQRGVTYLSGTTIRLLANTTPIICRDDTDIFDIILPGNQTVDRTNIGVNGLDVGPITGDTMYDFYVIADTTGVKATGCLMAQRGLVPVLPTGYDVKRFLIALPTNASNNFIPFVATYIGNAYNVTYNAAATSRIILDGGQGVTPTVVSAEFSTVGAPMIPTAINVKLQMTAEFTTAAAGDEAYLLRDDSNFSIGTSGSFIKPGFVGTQAVEKIINITNANNPTFKYNLNNSSASLNLYFDSYDFSLR